MMVKRLCLASLILAGVWCVSPSSTATPPSSPPLSPAVSEATQAASDVWYEIFVRSWYDSNGDGIGDLNGVTAKLDYLQELGVSGIWLMPINPSPSYHGYDITDYYGINPQYGTMADFQRLLKAAHQRGIKVIMDLAINHTSNEDPWFTAAQNVNDPHHDWYNWAGARTNLKAISATGSPAWHATPDGQHYMGIFVARMPDLNYDNPAVRKEMIKLGRFWLNKGVDGFRLDAAQHIYFNLKSQDGDKAVLKQNLQWWSQFMRGIDAVNPDAYVIGEVTQKTPEALAPWFGAISAVFDFPLADQLIASARAERRGKLGPLLQRTADDYRKVTDRSGVDAPFLSNHDQERVMSQLGGNAQHMRTAAALLLTLPGDPFIYYGEELGMRGKKPDPDLREPMRWYRDPGKRGETRWKAFSAGDSAAVTVQAEREEPDSLLNYYRMLISWRRDISPLRDGALHVMPLPDPHLVAWDLKDADGHVLVVHNLSGQAASLDITPKAVSRFDRIREKSTPAISIVRGKLELPPYSTAILY